MKPKTPFLCLVSRHRGVSLLPAFALLGLLLPAPFAHADAGLPSRVSEPGEESANLALPLANTTRLLDELISAIERKDAGAIVEKATAIIKRGNPGVTFAHSARGAAYGLRGQFDLAIPDLTECTRILPDDPTGFYNLAVAYVGKRDNRDAAANFEKALSLNPSFFEAALHAAVAYKAMGDADKSDATVCGPAYEKAALLFGRAAEIRGIGKESSDALFNQAQALECQSRETDDIAPMEAAALVWRRFVEAAPNDAETPKVKTHLAALEKYLADVRDGRSVTRTIAR